MAVPVGSKGRELVPVQGSGATDLDGICTVYFQAAFCGVHMCVRKADRVATGRPFVYSSTITQQSEYDPKEIE